MHTERAQSLESARAALVEEFAAVSGAETAGDVSTTDIRELLPASIQGFLPLLAQRFARERLRAAVRVVPAGAGED